LVDITNGTQHKVEMLRPFLRLFARGFLLPQRSYFVAQPFYFFSKLLFRLICYFYFAASFPLCLSMFVSYSSCASTAKRYCR